MLTVFIQQVAALGAILLGITYIIGGLIVNLNLSRRGVVEYQILKVKYLVVGIIFLLQSIGIFVFAGLPAFGLLYWANNLVFSQAVNVVSMLAALSLLLAWARLPSNTSSFLGSWLFGFAATCLGAIFPMMILWRQMLVPRFDWLWDIISVQAVMTAALTFMAHLYHYSAFYYGHSGSSGVLDPIGIGIPSRVRLGVDSEAASILKSLGIPITKNNLSGDLSLLDETDQHYIISYEIQDENGTEAQTLKVAKGLIKIISYLPENAKSFQSKSTATSRKSKN